MRVHNEADGRAAALAELAAASAGFESSYDDADANANANADVDDSLDAGPGAHAAVAYSAKLGAALESTLDGLDDAFFSDLSKPLL